MRRAAWSLVVLLALPACTRPAAVGTSRPPAEHPSVSPTADPSRPPGDPGRSEPPCASYTLIGAVRGRAAVARRRPAASASEIAPFPARNAQGAHQVFPLLDRRVIDGETWYRALLPMRPNGSTGWISGRDLSLRRSDFDVEIDTKKLRLTVFKLCDRIASYPIGIGTKDTPTPHGVFFLNSLMRPPAGSIYGEYAYGLSAFSGVIRNWTGGGIVGIHGTNDPSSIGKRVSHGCIRMRNADIRALARKLPLGTLVTIR